MNYTEIAEKYPYAADELWKWYIRDFQKKPAPSWDSFSKSQFPLQVGVLERFFDERGIEIMINPPNHIESWQYYIGKDYAGKLFPTRSEAQIAAFERAFQILDHNLKQI